MNDNTEAEYEYRVMVRWHPSEGWDNYYGIRAYPQLGTARGLASTVRRKCREPARVRIERRPVNPIWEVVE